MSSVKDFLERKLNIKIKKPHKEYKNKLWHAMKIENAIKALSNGFLEPHTSHRFWKDGILRNDSHPEYEDSNWRHGWSLTRNKQYAISWGQVILEFDKDEIRKTHKITPVCWGALITRKPKFGHGKRETEEFVLSGGVKESTNYYKKQAIIVEEEYDEIFDKEKKTEKDLSRLSEIEDYNWIEEWSKPVGKKLNIEKNCVGVYLCERFLDIYKDKQSEELRFIIEHPLFKGFLSKKDELVPIDIADLMRNKNNKTTKKPTEKIEKKKNFKLKN